MPSPVKIDTKGNIEYTQSVDRVNYTLRELSRAALKDVGTLIQKRARPNMRRRRKGLIRKWLQWWIRQQEGDLVIGYKKNAFWGKYFEVGSEKAPNEGPLFAAVRDNIDEIRRIEGEYLSAIEDENRALGLIDEGEMVGDDDE